MILKDHVDAAIIAALKGRLSEIAVEEFAACTDRIKSRLNSEVDRIAMAVSREYSVNDSGTYVTLTIKKLQETGR